MKAHEAFLPALSNKIVNSIHPVLTDPITLKFLPKSTNVAGAVKCPCDVFFTIYASPPSVSVLKIY